MTETEELTLMTRLRDEATAGGLIVRFEKHGVLAIVLSKYGAAKQKEQHLGLLVEDRQEGRGIGQGSIQSADLGAGAGSCSSKVEEEGSN